jgi:outer membrane murein-binding lipoprotein Lpp
VNGDTDDLLKQILSRVTEQGAEIGYIRDDLKNICENVDELRHNVARLTGDVEAVQRQAGANKKKSLESQNMSTPKSYQPFTSLKTQPTTQTGD